MALEARAEPRLARGLDDAALDQAHVEARAAGVAHDDVLGAEVRVGVAARADRPHRRPGADAVDRALGHLGDVQAAADGGDDHEVAGEAVRLQVLGDLAQVLLHQRLQRRVDDGRGRAPVLAHGRVELVRERHRDAGPLLLEDLADAALVVRVGDRPQQADADRLHLRAAGGVDRLAYRVLVERAVLAALRVDPPADLERQPPRDVGLRVRDREVEGLHLPALAQGQDVGEALRGQERGARGGALDDRVGGAGRRVHEQVGVAEQLLEREVEAFADHAQRLAAALEHALRRGQRLVEREPAVGVGEHDVGEGAAGVDRDPVAHRAAHPPSMTSVVPCTNDAASEAR